MGELLDHIAAAAGSPRTHQINPGVRNRILILDVERIPGITEQTW